MSTPAPPYAPQHLGKALVQVGGPRGFSAASVVSSAVTFATAMPDTSYGVDITIVSGQISGSWSLAGPTVNNFAILFLHGVGNGAYLWRAWRIT